MATAVATPSYGDGFGVVKPSTLVPSEYLGEQKRGGQGRIKICSRRELERASAVVVIEKWWRVVKDRRVFNMLKQAICTSEYSLTREIIRKVSPIEAELLGDPAIQAKIKFRFGGEKFPPIIVFKIFTSMCASDQVQGKVKYISGRRMIRPSSEAAMDAKRQMGDRRYHQQVLHDMNEHEHFGATDEVDISTTKDYMQYLSNVDESPAYLGGKDNTWRRLDLTSLPRHTPLHNLVDLLDSSRQLAGGNVSLQKLESSLRQPQSETRPGSTLSDYELSSSRRSQVRSEESCRGSDGGQRRSRQARRRAELMKAAYREGRETAELPEGSTKQEEPWEEDIDDLYQWTQKLSFDDIR